MSTIATTQLIKGKKVAVIGYGSQGHAHALNLRGQASKRGMALRSSQGLKAEGEKHGGRRGRQVDGCDDDADARRAAEIYRDHLALHEEGAALMLHGLNIRSPLIARRSRRDDIAPGPGQRFVQRARGVPSSWRYHACRATPTSR